MTEREDAPIFGMPGVLGPKDAEGMELFLAEQQTRADMLAGTMNALLALKELPEEKQRALQGLGRLARASREVSGVHRESLALEMGLSGWDLLRYEKGWLLPTDPTFLKITDEYTRRFSPAGDTEDSSEEAPTSLQTLIKYLNSV